jgi:hypothetical protein
VTTSGLVQGIDLFDWSAGSWVQIDVRPATLVDQVVDVPVADPGRFVEPGTRRMRAQVRFKPNGPMLGGRWAARIDRVAWTVR